MIEQIIMQNKIYWRGPAKELRPYLRRLSKEYTTVKELIHWNLH